ncbi:hypothetical protein N7468_006402 [Penicillium chermesinum]|uniref:Uncharacterized protein n=1 Tax=Penicillium chermesinum TaxID=63820 RepID=A0A9W9NS57_9EURO|nr:uncharacterized protein N7468_006402 [Penicillium chermesinum]KAJ5225177.1 hypothetical protein N7468_006402 [Penicillium chermesinum]
MSALMLFPGASPRIGVKAFPLDPPQIHAFHPSPAMTDPSLFNGNNRIPQYTFVFPSEYGAILTDSLSPYNPDGHGMRSAHMSRLDDSTAKSSDNLQSMHAELIENTLAEFPEAIAVLSLRTLNARSAEHFPEALQRWCQTKNLTLRRHFSRQKILKEDATTNIPLCRLVIQGPGIEGELQTYGNGPSQAVAAQNSSMAMLSELEKKGQWNLTQRAIALRLSSRRERLRKARALLDDGSIEATFEISEPSPGVYISHAVFRVPVNDKLERHIQTSGSTPREAKLMAILRYVSHLELVHQKDYFALLLQTAADRRARQALQDLIESSERKSVSNDDLQALGQMWDQKCFRIDLQETKSSCTASLVLLQKRYIRPSRRSRSIISSASFNGRNMRQNLEKAILGLIPRLKEKSGLWAILQDRASESQLSITDNLLQEIQSARDDLLKAIENLPNVAASEELPQGYKRSICSPEYERTRSSQLKLALQERERDRKKRNPQAELEKDKLPVSKFKKEVLELVNGSLFSVFASKTGSGKSTQVPQILLDDAAARGKGGQCRVLCIQPRRVAAQLLAERVAKERNESVGQTVGCIVRFHHRDPYPAGSITYCTTGIALAMLGSRSMDFLAYSHIILDEAHVRDVGIDLLMILLKRVVVECQSKGVPVPKIVIMSATIDLDLFTSYFSVKDSEGRLIAAPSLSLPGNAYNVKFHFLDDILDSLTTTFTPEKLGELMESDQESTQWYLNDHYKRFDMGHMIEEPDLEHAALAATILHILSTTESGAILVFLPGISSIRALDTYIRRVAEPLGFDLSNEDLFRVIIAHAEYPLEMAKMRLPYPKECRRIFLSTDVTEASVTIPDVNYVIDTAKLHRIIHDPVGGVSEMTCSWIGKSNATQRAGRAGRVRPGEYFFLGTKRRFDTLPASISPEFIRSDLRAICLKAKVIAPDIPIPELLAQNIDPPDPVDVNASIESLRLLKALDKDSELTPLGGASLSNPTSPTAEEWGAFDDRTGFLGTPESDHISMIKTFDMLRKLVHEKGIPAALRCATENGLNVPNLRTDFSLAHQILDHLAKMDIIPKSAASPAASAKNKIFGGPELNTNSNNEALIKALLLHCLPRIARPHSTSQRFRTKNQTDLRFPVRLASVKNHLKQVIHRRQFAIFTSLFQSPDGLLQPKNISFVTPLMACLFGSRLDWSQNRLRIDSWLPIRLRLAGTSVSEEEAAHAITSFRETIDMALDAALSTFSPELAFETEDQRKQFIHQRSQLLESFRNAVCRVIDADTHRITSFRPPVKSHPAPNREADPVTAIEA